MSLSRICALLALGAASSLTQSCALFRGGGPSEVAQGRYYSAANPEFDSFFVGVYRLQVTMARAPGELSEARRSLTEALLLDDSAQNAEIAEKLKLSLNGLSAHGTRVHFEARLPSPPDPDHSMALISATPTPDGKEASQLATLEGSLTRLFRLAATMHQSEAELVTLRGAIPSLQGKLDVELKDQGSSKRAQTRQNLEDAERVIVLMQARASETAAPIDGLYKEIGQVFGKAEPAANEPAQAAVKSEEKPRPRAQPARPRADAPAAPAAAPATSPKAAPAKSADFEP
jgi:hypothetical protein